MAQPPHVWGAPPFKYLGAPSSPRWRLLRLPRRFGTPTDALFDCVSPPRASQLRLTHSSASLLPPSPCLQRDWRHATARVVLFRLCLCVSATGRPVITARVRQQVHQPARDRDHPRSVRQPTACPARFALLRIHAALERSVPLSMSIPVTLAARSARCPLTFAWLLVCVTCSFMRRSCSSASTPEIDRIDIPSQRPLLGRLAAANSTAA